MNLLAKTAEFERLCRNLLKRSADPGPSSSWRIDPETGQMEDTIPPASLSGPTPRFKVHNRPETNPAAKPAPLNPGAHPDLEHAVKDAPAPQAATPTKPKQPASWLNRYMGKDKEQDAAAAEFVARQKTQNQALLDAPSAVQPTLDRINKQQAPKPAAPATSYGPSSVQPAIDRSNKVPTFDAERAAREQAAKAKS